MNFGLFHLSYLVLSNRQKASTNGFSVNQCIKCKINKNLDKINTIINKPDKIELKNNEQIKWNARDLKDSHCSSSSVNPYSNLNQRSHGSFAKQHLCETGFPVFNSLLSFMQPLLERVVIRLWKLKGSCGWRRLEFECNSTDSCKWTQRSMSHVEIHSTVCTLLVSSFFYSVKFPKTRPTRLRNWPSYFMYFTVCNVQCKWSQVEVLHTQSHTMERNRYIYSQHAFDFISLSCTVAFLSLGCQQTSDRLSASVQCKKIIDIWWFTHCVGWGKKSHLVGGYWVGRYLM